MSVQFGHFIDCCSSTHGASRAQPFVKVGEGGTCPPYHMESAPLASDELFKVAVADLDLAYKPKVVIKKISTLHYITLIIK